MGKIFTTKPEKERAALKVEASSTALLFEISNTDVAAHRCLDFSEAHALRDALTAHLDEQPEKVKYDFEAMEFDRADADRKLADQTVCAFWWDGTPQGFAWWDKHHRDEIGKAALRDMIAQWDAEHGEAKEADPEDVRRMEADQIIDYDEGCITYEQPTTLPQAQSLPEADRLRLIEELLKGDFTDIEGVSEVNDSAASLLGRMIEERRNK